MYNSKEVVYIILNCILIVFLKWQYEEVINDKPDNIVELVRQSRNGHWFSISQIRIARNVETEITNFIYDKIRTADYSFSKYEFKYMRFSANTTTSFIQFERTADHLEFIKLLDRCEFNGIRLKVSK
jgi:hypothetical protein